MWFADSIGEAPQGRRSRRGGGGEKPRPDSRRLGRGGAGRRRRHRSQGAREGGAAVSNGPRDSGGPGLAGRRGGRDRSISRRDACCNRSTGDRSRKTGPRGEALRPEWARRRGGRAPERGAKGSGAGRAPPGLSPSRRAVAGAPAEGRVGQSILFIWAAGEPRSGAQGRKRAVELRAS